MVTPRTFVQMDRTEMKGEGLVSCDMYPDPEWVGSDGTHRGLVKRTPDSSSGTLVGDGGVDWWINEVDNQNLGQVGWVVSVTDIVVSDEPRVFQ